MHATSNPLAFAWLEVTGLCNLTCDHCYADSSPQGTHGTMILADWCRVIGELADMGTKDVQFIGGEPTMHPDLAELIRHTHRVGIEVEVFSNLTHVQEELWTTFMDCGVKLATSYYSDEATDHDQVTRVRGSHERTRANIERALALGIPLRGGVVAVRQGQRARQAANDLVDLGVPEVGRDRTRAFGRGSRGAAPAVDDLCGHCAQGKCAILPDGSVSPCVLGRFLTIGNVHDRPLADIWGSTRTAAVLAGIKAVHGAGAQRCTPPQFLPMCGPCGPCVPSVQTRPCDPKLAADEPDVATIAAAG
ncbi:radical SAM protein [Streptomyces sp. NPDC054796]